jgi:transposase
MLTVNDYEIIRRRVLLDGRSQREAAKELGHSRKTVAKALEDPAPPGYRMSKARASPVMGPYQPFVEAWLGEDDSAPPKQRHTARRVYERLRDEHGFEGDEGTVRRFVARLKDERPGEAFMPLVFGPGEEGQVDWGEAKVVVNGAPRAVQLFCVRLCYSKASFVYPYERATMEAFLDGHVRAFEFFGGVLRRLAYDNLKAAVTHVGRGRERVLNERFARLRSHYLFDTRFCNVASGNEKGHVENLVKRCQRSYLTPVPHVTGIASDTGDTGDLAGRLLECCRRDLLKVDGRQGPQGPQALSRGQLLERERAAMLPLPGSPFPACREHGTRVGKQALVRFDCNDYSVPVEHAHRPCVVRGFVHRVEVEVGHETVASHARGYGRGQFVLEPLHYLPLLVRKPGSLDNARPFKQAGSAGSAGSGQSCWGEALAAMRRELELRQPCGEGTRQFIQILQLALSHPMAEVERAVGECVRRRAYGAAAVLSVLRNEPPRPAAPRLDLSGRAELAGAGDGTRPLSAYDRLSAPPACEAACEAAGEGVAS